jgi:HK97 family phage portal protein
MALLSRLKNAVAAFKSDAAMTSLDLWRQVYGGGRESKSGQTVNWQTALEVTTALACTRVLSEGVAQVPLKLFEPTSDGKGSEAAEEHPLYEVLYRRPNPWQTSFEFRETMMFHSVLCGNFFAYKNRVGSQIRELIPFTPGMVSVKQLADYRLVYTVRGVDGSTRDFTQDDIWHVRGPSWNSWMGLEGVRLVREALGLALATEEHHARMHQQGVNPSGVMSVEGTLGADEYKNLDKWISDNYAGTANKHGVMIIDRKGVFTPFDMKGVDSQHLETRRFQIEEICRAFRVMPIMVGGASDKTPTYASAEQMFLAHVVYSLLPWGTRLEQSIDVNLLTDADREAGMFAKFNWNALQRGAFKDRTDAYSKALGSGGSPAWMTPNEIRALEEMNPIAGGDDLPVPTNPATPQDPANPPAPGT